MKREATMEVPACRVCGLAILEVLDHGRDLWDGLCGECAYRKFMLQHGNAAPEPCEWCSEPAALTEWPDPDGLGASWVCVRCLRGALAGER